MSNCEGRISVQLSEKALTRSLTWCSRWTHDVTAATAESRDLQFSDDFTKSVEFIIFNSIARSSKDVIYLFFLLFRRFTRSYTPGWCWWIFNNASSLRGSLSLARAPFCDLDLPQRGFAEDDWRFFNILSQLQPLKKLHRCWFVYNIPHLLFQS